MMAPTPNTLIVTMNINRLHWLRSARIASAAGSKQMDKFKGIEIAFPSNVRAAVC